MSIFSRHAFICRRVLLQKLSSSPLICNQTTFRGKATCSLDPNNLVASRLESRSLIKVSGPDSRIFLQGLITNDINILEAQPSIYTLFLNHQGRVLYDAILYSNSTKQPEEILIECDASIKSALMKYLNVYRIRKKVEISDAANNELNLHHNVWVIFDSTQKEKVPSRYLVNNTNTNDNSSNCDNGKPESSLGCNPEIGKETYLERPNVEEELCCRPLAIHSSQRHDLGEGDVSLQAISDPRLELLGFRVLQSSKNDIPKDIHKFKVVPESEYRQLRYALGVGEGVLDLPPANCFPLESNADYLRGISFQKGCYIGQELTARTHHTGVVRKRLMPFTFSPSSFSGSIPQQLFGKEGKSIAKVRGVQNCYGLVLARIADVLNSPEIKLEEHVLRIGKPDWWPVELSSKSQLGK